MFTMESLLIVGLALAFAQFLLFVYLHRHQLGLVKYPEPRFQLTTRTDPFEKFMFAYMGFVIGVILVKLAERYGWGD